MRRRVRTCVRIKDASLQGYSAFLRARATRWRDLLRKRPVRMRAYVYCRRKAVITMLNERFVALYSDDISPVTDCDGLANIFRSRRHLVVHGERHIWELSVICGALRIARASSTKSYDYANVLLCELFTVTSLNHQVYHICIYLFSHSDTNILYYGSCMWSASRDCWDNKNSKKY